MAELKVQLEVSEGETGLLRKKVEGLLTGLATNVVFSVFLFLLTYTQFNLYRHTHLEV